MKRWVALFRGINVGTAKRVPMAELRKIMGGLGYGDVVTVLNSGNVLFGTPGGAAAGHAGRIRAAVRAALGVDAQVTVVAAEVLAAIMAVRPLEGVATDPSRLLVAFGAEGSMPGELQAMATLDWAPDRLELGPDAAYLWCPAGIHESRLFKELNRRLGEGITTRNWTTVAKIASLLQSDNIKGCGLS